MHLCFLRYLLLENKRFADDRALPIRVIRVIRGEVISAFPRRDFGNADRCVAGRTLDRAADPTE